MRASERFRASYLWAITARYFDHPSVMDAYENAFSLMQDTRHYAPVQQFSMFTNTPEDLYRTGKLHHVRLTLAVAAYLACAASRNVQLDL